MSKDPQINDILTIFPHTLKINIFVTKSNICIIPQSNYFRLCHCKLFTKPMSLLLIVLEYNGGMKRHKFLIIELIVWGFIVCAIGYNLFLNHKSNLDRTYNIYVEDAAGLVKGAPVHLMGVNIGYIKKVKVQDDKVLVVVLANRKDVKMPNKAVASIEFYGLGGSTYLELKPLDDIDKEDTFEIIPGKSCRVQDYWNGQKLTSNTMFNLYSAMGRNIDKSGLLYNKQILFQSDTIMEFINKTNKINSEQAVIINKLNKTLED